MNLTQIHITTSSFPNSVNFDISLELARFTIYTFGSWENDYFWNNYVVLFWDKIRGHYKQSIKYFMV